MGSRRPARVHASSLFITPKHEPVARRCMRRLGGRGFYVSMLTLSCGSRMYRLVTCAERGTREAGACKQGLV